MIGNMKRALAQLKIPNPDSTGVALSVCGYTVPTILKIIKIIIMFKNYILHLPRSKP